MLFTNVLLAGFAAAATAAPTVVERQVPQDIVPWEIDRVVISNSGPHATIPTSTLAINISNPNTYKIQRVPHGYAVFPKFKAQCNWRWDLGPMPYGFENACVVDGDQEIYGNLTMTLRKVVENDSTSFSLFAVDIKETRASNILGKEYLRIWQGSAEFGRNMQTLCGNQGQCSAALKSEFKPVLVKQELTTSVGRCQDNSIGGC